MNVKMIEIRALVFYVFFSAEGMMNGVQCSSINNTDVPNERNLARNGEFFFSNEDPCVPSPCGSGAEPRPNLETCNCICLNFTTSLDPEDNSCKPSTNSAASLKDETRISLVSFIAFFQFRVFSRITNLFRYMFIQSSFHMNLQ